LFELGFLDQVFHLLDYIDTPLPTNVYTIFGVYYNDFGFLGVLFFMFVFSFWSTVVHLGAVKLASFRLMLLSSFYLSFIVLGVFYDYYTSSMFSFLAPVLIFFLIPASYSRS
jgi:oligosaccharide repeat unit polymerase